MAYAVRYIVFPRPPTLSECREPFEPGEWHVSSPYPLDPVDTPRPPPTSVDDTVSSSDTEMSPRVDRDPYAGALYPDDSYDISTRALPHKPSGSTSLPNYSFGVLPPPTQVRQHTQQSRADLFAYTQYSHDTTSFLEPPPSFDWRPSELTPLSRLRELLKKGPRVTVSCLAVVIKFSEPRTTMNGVTMADWELIDSSGAIATMVLWGDMAVAWCDEVQNGDIIFVGNAGLGEYQNKLQIKPRAEGKSGTSRLQVCYRTREVDGDDSAYVFDEAHAQLLPAAAAVIGLRDWWQRKR